mgnify:CR=1 FL=1
MSIMSLPDTQGSQLCGSKQCFLIIQLAPSWYRFLFNLCYIQSTWSHGINIGAAGATNQALLSPYIGLNNDPHNILHLWVLTLISYILQNNNTHNILE